MIAASSNARSGLFVQCIRIEVPAVAVDENPLHSIRAFGPGLQQAQVGVQTSFTIDTRAASQCSDDVKVLVTTPSKHSCPMQVVNNRDGTWTVHYTPQEVGETYLDIFLADELVPGCPFKVNIFDVRQIHVSNVQGGLVHQLVKFEIDASRAGVGQLEIVIQDGRIPCDAMPRGSFHFDASFLAHEPGAHTIDIRFNGLPVPDSPFTCYIIDLSRVSISDSLCSAQIGVPLSFDIYHWNVYDLQQQTAPLDVAITTPSGRSVSFLRTQLNDSITRIDYVLHEIGTHRVDIRSNQTGSGKMDINGSPFALKAFDASRLVVSDIPRLVTLNHPVEFTVDASKAGEGQLEVAINDGLVPNQVKALGSSKFLFTFLPKNGDPHVVSIKFNGQPLSGFPKECQVFSTDDITTRGPGLTQALLGAQTWFTVETPQGGSSDIQVIVHTPSNEQINPSTRLTSDGLRVDWVPTEVGTYTVHVSFAGNVVPGSPFRVKCYDPKKVIVTPPSNDSAVGKPTRFLVDASGAGEGNLEISVNHSGRNIPNQVNPIGNSRFEVQFTPQEATVHYCNIHFNGELVPGSPFGVNVMDTQRVVAFGKGLGSVPVNVPASFSILTQNAGVGDLRCSIKDPHDHVIACVMTKMASNRFEVTYTPECIGDFRIEVFLGDTPIENSPLTARAFDMSKVKITDFPSVAMLDSSTSFIIDAAEAGSGNLEIAVSSNEKNIPNTVQNEGGTRFRVKFIPNHATIHDVNVKFNGNNIPGSPFQCHVFPSDFSFENYEYASIHKRTSFLIKPKLNSPFKSQISFDIISPSGDRLDGDIEEKSSNVFALHCVPTEIGDHEILFYRDESKQMPMMKFLCQVYDASQIHVGDLRPAIPNQPYKFTVSTAAAGPGQLAVKIKQNNTRLVHEEAELAEHVHEITFVPETTVQCTIDISFNGENNLGTLVVPILADSQLIRVSTIPTGVVGQPIVFTIDLTEPKPVSLSITETQGDRVIPHTMKSLSNEDTRYQISFIPMVARQHTILISSENQLLATHHVDVFNVNKIRVSEIQDGLVGLASIFTVDTHGAGEGHLEVTISDGRRTLPAELKRIQARKFDIGFMPEISGQHSISIAFNGMSVEGSPFVIRVRDPPITEKPGIEEDKEEDEEVEDDEDEDDDIEDHEFLIGGQLEGTKVGELAWLICNTPLSDIYEDFDLFVTDPDQNTVKHTRIQDSAGRWRIEFEPMKAGIYQIHTNDQNSDESPIILASMDILAETFHRNIEGERIIHPQVLNYILINSKSEHLKIQLRRSNADEVPFEVEQNGSEWKIYFTLAETDDYQLSISEQDDEQVYDIHCVAEETDIFRNGGIDDITRVIVDQSKITGSDVNVIVKDPLAHTIPAAFYRNMNHDLIIEYVPTKLDSHEVFIRTQNNLLDMCPIRIMSFGASNTVEPVLRVQVKEVLEHTFEGVLDHIDKLQIELLDPFDRPLPFQRSFNERGELTIALSPVRVGTHWIRVSNNESTNFALLPIFAFDDDYVPLSPVSTPAPRLDKPPKKPKASKHTNQNNNNNVEPLKDISVPVVPGKDLTGISETSDILSSRTSSISSSKVSETAAVTSPTVANDHLKSSKTNGRSSPEVQILDITDLEDPGVRVVSKFSFRDVDDKLHIKIYDADGNQIQYQAEYLTDGRKRIFYEPAVIGPVEIHIFKDNQPIDGSPLVVYAFDPAAVRLIDFPKKIQLNAMNRFIIDPTKAGKGSLKISIKNPNNRSLAMTVLKRSNGHVAVEFQPLLAGVHTISILFNRIAIPDTPLRVVADPTSVSQLPNEPIEERITHRGHGIVEQYQRLKDGSLRLVLHFDKPEHSDWERIRGKYSIRIKRPTTDHQEPSRPTDKESRSRSHSIRPQEAERARSLSAEKILDPIHSRLSKSNENILQSISSNHPSSSVESQPARTTTRLTDAQIQRYQLLKEKFDRQQPIDLVFDPRRYPFKVLLQHPYPLANTDVHLFIDLPHIAYVHVSINGMEVPIQAARRHDDTFLLKFRPTIAGDYSIVLKDFVEQPVLGCPFILPVFNPSVIQLESFNRLQPLDDCHVICNIDKAGPGKFFVMVYGLTDDQQLQPILIPIQIRSLPSNQMRISFSPPTVGTYRIYIAYRNLPINGTPIDLTVYDARRVSIVAEHTQPVVVRTNVIYKVNTSQAGQGQFKVELISPQTVKTACRCTVQELAPDEFLVQYTPLEPGQYQLRVLFNNKLVQGKSLITDVQPLANNPSVRSVNHSPPPMLVLIHQLHPSGTPEIGDDICLQITTEHAFIKSIQGQISCNGMSVPCQIERNRETQGWLLTFRPYVPGAYKIHLLHNGSSILSSPYLIQVNEIHGKVLLSGLEQILLTNTPCVIQVHVESASEAEVRAVVLLGTRPIVSTTSIVNDKLIRIHFIPVEPGLYSVHVTCAHQPIEGSPFSIRVERPRLIQISGECFHRLRLNDLGIFRVHCHGQRGPIEAKIFNLSAADRLDVGQKISFQLQDTYEQLLQYSPQVLLPAMSGLLMSRLRISPERIRHLTLGKEHGRTTVSFQLHELPTQIPTNEQIIHNLRQLIHHQQLNLVDPNRSILHTVDGSVVVGPKGELVNVKLFPQASGDYTGEFTPNKIGQHRIDITFANMPVQGSPFFTEVYDPSQVRIGPLPRDIIVGAENSFEIHLDNAGNVPLEIKMSSPTGLHVPLKVEDVSSRTTAKKVRFTSTETGIHYLSAKFGSEIVPGTPIKMMVNDARVVAAYGDGIHHALHEKPATFMIDTQDMQGDLKVRIEGPNSVIKNTLERTGDSLFKVIYVPVEVGTVNISIKWNGKDIANSPFKSTVTNPERVRIVGGWQSILDAEDRMHLIINEEKKIRFDTSQAGPGTLKAEIRSTDGLRVPLRIDQQGQFHTLCFTATREGKYDLTITYDGNPLPNMPIRADAGSAGFNSSDHLKVEVQGRGSHEAKVSEEAEFIIDASKAGGSGNGMPVVRLTGVQADIEVRIRQMENNIFRCVYVPTAAGAYLLSVTWADRQVRGSPFKVNVLPNTLSNQPASRVICSGDGLKMGIIGKEIKCLIDTRSAGPGELTAYCQGVVKTAFCRLFDHRDGTFTLFIKPQESGRHTLNIKYNDDHVLGSPYTLKVSGPPDASKVHVSGPGIGHGVLSTFQSHFICETKGAGAGQLTVKIRGPKGAFRVEMQREHLQDRTIICRYNPSEPGDYLISVKWSDEHVYGSPFHSHIFERQEELDRFLHEQNAYRLAQQQWRDEI